MKKANYIIFHPPRETIIAEATIMNKENEIIRKWVGQIFVDNVNNGNEDPFVFNNPWIYSYCHASQLRRNKRHDSFLQKDSIIIFVNGVDADKNILTIDTVFIVEEVLQWEFFYRQPQEVPIKYLSIKNTDSDLWERYFKFPFPPFYAHKNVTHSYEARLWDRGVTNYSFLPLNEDGTNISISFSELDTNLSAKLNKNKKGKYPILIEDEYILEDLMRLIESKTSIKVLNDIRFIKSINKMKNGRCHSIC